MDSNKIQNMAGELSHADETGWSPWSIFAYELVTAASEYFSECPEDFGLQAVGEVVIFGGVNRLRWNPATGFYPDRPYCTEKFLAHYDKIGNLPGIRA